MGDASTVPSSCTCCRCSVVTFAAVIPVGSGETLDFPTSHPNCGQSCVDAIERFTGGTLSSAGRLAVSPDCLEAGAAPHAESESGSAKARTRKPREYSPHSPRGAPEESLMRCMDSISFPQGRRDAGYGRREAAQQASDFPHPVSHPSELTRIPSARFAVPTRMARSQAGLRTASPPF